uniref:Transposase (Putative), gypsy type n=1 Tax=Tanacetum cinerariifolium TaxID=118510 RepID=A0A6L2MEY9_TANCI|nr:hypothetical protein [Tanacetum cinerariifolium]
MAIKRIAHATMFTRSSLSSISPKEGRKLANIVIKKAMLYTLSSEYALRSTGSLIAIEISVIEIVLRTKNLFRNQSFHCRNPWKASTAIAKLQAKDALATYNPTHVVRVLEGPPPLPALVILRLWEEGFANVLLGSGRVHKPRDTIQLETAVSTISQEYLLEFTSEYGISEDLHPELPGPEERIVDFSIGKVGVDSLKNWNNRFFWVDERVFPTVADWRVSAPKDEMPAEDTYSLEAVAVLNTHHTPIQKQPEALLCLVGLSRRYFLGDDVYPTFLHDDDRGGYGFAQFDLCSDPTKVKIGTRPRAAHEVPLLTVTASRVIEMEDPAAEIDSSRIPFTIERSPLDFANENPSQQSIGGDKTEDEGQETVALEVPPPENVTTTRVAPKTGLVREIAAMGPRVIKEHRKKGNDEVDANVPPKVLRKNHADSRPTQSTIGGKSLASMGLETGSTFPVPTLQETPTDVSDLDGLSFANPQSIPKQDVVQSSKGAAIVGDPESENTSFTSMVGSPESIYQPEWARKVAMGSQLRLRFEQKAKLLKKSIAQVARRDQRIQARENEIKNLEALLEAETDMKKAAEAKNAELVKELENLRAQFTDIQRFMKCGESTELRKVFADVVSAGIAKGLSEGLKYGLKSLKDASIDVIMASLHLESDYGEDAPQWIHELHPSSSQLKIPVYSKVRDLKDSWSFKEEILLKDAIAANVSRVEKKKKCRVVCRTHGVSFAHHARSDGVPVTVPIVAL